MVVSSSSTRSISSIDVSIGSALLKLFCGRFVEKSSLLRFWGESLMLDEVKVDELEAEEDPSET